MSPKQVWVSQKAFRRSPEYWERVWLTALGVSFVLGVCVLVVSGILVGHDYLAWRGLDADYRSGIVKLESNWGYSELLEAEQVAVSLQQQAWNPYENGRPVRADRFSPVENLERLVPRWGSRMHQRRPFLAMLLSLLGFVPCLGVYWGREWWEWLNRPVGSVPDLSRKRPGPVFAGSFPESERNELKANLGGVFWRDER